MVSLLLAIVLLVSACTVFKSAKSAEDFTEYFKEAGFKVYDITARAESNGKASSVLVATNDSYQLEFYVMKDTETAENAFSQNKKVFTEKKPLQDLTTTIDSRNYNFYSTTDSGMFYVISRVKDTILYGTISAECRDEVKQLIGDFGY